VSFRAQVSHTTAIIEVNGQLQMLRVRLLHAPEHPDEQKRWRAETRIPPSVPRLLCAGHGPDSKAAILDMRETARKAWEAEIEREERGGSGPGWPRIRI
jgi:hypothetical protein